MEILSLIRNALPNKTAIEHGDSKITYKELIAAADILAERYRNDGLGPGRAIAVENKRGIECIVAWLAAWITDAAFVAIDPILPDARKEIYRKYCYQLADSCRSGYEFDKRIGYVFLSSGSTGTPKAILMPTTGLASVIQSQIKNFSIDEKSRVLWMLSPGFDASLSDVLTALCAGATLVIADTFSDVKTFSTLLHDARITHMDIAPSLLSRLLKNDLPKTVQTIIVGGEVCTQSVLNEFADDFRLVNCYGPTETTICSSMKVLGRDTDPRNIGQPNAGFTYLVCDGELWINGPGTAISYGGNRQADKFVIHQERRWFKTGDRVEKRGGDYLFLGRVDRQFKINGQLVNPEEIERHLLHDDAILECRVEKQDGKLIAFCLSNAAFDSREVLENLRLELPAWMIPRLVRIDDMPRNERGKVMFDALGKEEVQRSSCVFQRTMSKMLGYDVGDYDDFWKVGGDSLLAFDFIQALAETGYQLHIETLRIASTPSALRQVGLPKTITKENVLEDAENIPRLNISRVQKKTNVILLTGATGFLGRRVLDLLVDAGHKVVCIVRAENDERARERVGKKTRTDVFSGDLLLPNWGLEQSRFQQLSEQCDTVIHLAADLNLSKPYEPDSVCRALSEMGHFLEAGIEKSMVFASSLSVFASTDFSGIAKENNHNFEGVENIYGGYTAEKMLAETIVRKRFLNATILRFGLLTGDSQTGEFHDKNVLVSFIRTIVHLNMSVKSTHLRFDLTPVDYAARATVNLMDEPGTFHIANSEPPSLDALIAGIETCSGSSIARVSNEVFLAALHACVGNDAQLARVASARLHSKITYDILRSGDLFLATDIDFDGAGTQARLAAQGCKRSEVNERLLVRYVEWSLGSHSDPIAQGKK